jgi:nucleoside-diphosphate-sugar epimerase
MTVLVTGATGFVGLNIVHALIAGGERVVGFDFGAAPAAARAMLQAYGAAFELVTGDVRDAATVDAVFARGKVQRVVHAAAITSGAAREAREPHDIVTVNVQGTLNVLDAARRHGVQRFLYVGSGAAYGESLYRLARVYENSASAPITLYAITKYTAERACLRLKDLWQLDLACVRLGTVIGPWERDTGARDNYGTHTQLAAMAAAGRTALLTPREVRRDWVYSRDVAAAVAALLDAKTLHRPVYNVSSGVEWQEPIAAWCAALKGAFPKFDYRVADKGEEANIWYTDRDRCIMDIGRLEQDTGFRVAYPMAQAYAHYIEWICGNRAFYLEAAQA